MTYLLGFGERYASNALVQSACGPYQAMVINTLNTQSKQKPRYDWWTGPDRFIPGRVSPRVGVEGWEKSRPPPPHRDSIPGPSIP